MEALEVLLQVVSILVDRTCPFRPQLLRFAFLQEQRRLTGDHPSAPDKLPDAQEESLLAIHHVEGGEQPRGLLAT